MIDEGYLLQEVVDTHTNLAHMLCHDLLKKKQSIAVPYLIRMLLNLNITDDPTVTEELTKKVEIILEEVNIYIYIFCIRIQSYPIVHFLFKGYFNSCYSSELFICSILSSQPETLTETRPQLKKIFFECHAQWEF